MPQAWGLAHFSSKNGLQNGIFHEAGSTRLASNPAVHQCSTVFPSESAWEAVKPRV